jgi:hypothetical protein
MNDKNPRHRGTPEERRRLFSRALLEGRSAQDALIDAGFKLTTRKAIASTISSLRRHPEIKAILDSEERAQRIITADTPARVQAAISGIAFSDVGQLLNSDGTLRPLDSIAPEVRSAIKQLIISTYTAPDGSSSTRTVKVTLENKVAALQTLGEVVGLISPEVTQAAVAQAFQVNIHLGAENVAVGQERNRLVRPQPAIETTTELPPRGETRN